MVELWGALLILILCPLLGALPLIALVTKYLAKKQLTQLGTGNIGVSAAFYHGGTLVGILAVLSEAFKGIAAVMLARAYFPDGSAWELIALITLVLGRYWTGGGAGTTNVVWGFAVHDPLTTAFVFLVAGISFTILRSRQIAKFGVLVLFPLIVAILHFNNFPLIVAAIALASLLGWIYTQISDDLDLPVEEAQTDSQGALQFFRGDRSILSLDDDLDEALVGAKAGKLSQMRRWGYSVPKGWVLLPFDDPQPLIDYLQPSELFPLAVRSTAIGEDSEFSSAAGQYETILNVTTKEGLEQAINRIQVSYNSPRAQKYRSDRGLKNSSMAVLVQQQVRSLYSGVAFSRDPITQESDAVVIEALPGSPTQVVSGRVTPEQYRAFVTEGESNSFIQLEGAGKVPQILIKQVAYLSRQIEDRYHGIPQDIEWCYDGQTLWLLQARPITTLVPIWTRKIAAEVIPGVIHPLTWSINRPLVCGVWGGIFAIVLSERAVGLDFNETATLHYSHAYFNATLLGEIFRLMGLPPESLEFLTRGAKFSKPPMESTLQNLPGLFRLLIRELCLEKDFKRDFRKHFQPILSEISEQPAEDLDPVAIWERIVTILELLRKATYYSILAPLSASLRQSVLRKKDTEIDNSQTPEVAALKQLTELARKAKSSVADFHLETNNSEFTDSEFADSEFTDSWFTDPPINNTQTNNSEITWEKLSQTPPGKEIIAEFEQYIDTYGYLSEVGTNIAVPTWKENPETIRQLFIQLMQGNTPVANDNRGRKRKAGTVQKRVDLKGKVTEIYSRLLAELRWCFIALEKSWINPGILQESGDIFFLELDEIQKLVENSESSLNFQLPQIIQQRKKQFAADSQHTRIPRLVYGNTPPPSPFFTQTYSDHQLKGIPASPGQAEGRVTVLRNLQSIPEIDSDTILVVPYTDSGWAPFLVKAGGLIADAGGKLSHGAILAREYGIPAIMDVKNATWMLQDGQRVRIDGYRGIIEISNDLRPS
ncbi:MAG: glycerol-3-phosphate acyltransferase [Cyanobacteria bacterium P01_A01_bin.45]